MTTTQASEAGRTLVRRRWDRPEHIERRVERLIAEIAKLPALTPSQRARLKHAIGGA